MTVDAEGTSPTGVPTLPDNVAGVPIVITDSLRNDEAGCFGDQRSKRSRFHRVGASGWVLICRV